MKVRFRAAKSRNSLSQEGEEVRTLPLDVRLATGMMKGDHEQQGRLELLPGPSVFVVQHTSVGPCSASLAIAHTE